MAEQNVQETQVQDARKKISKKKIAIWSGVVVAVAGLATTAFCIIRKFRKA